MGCPRLNRNLYSRWVVVIAHARITSVRFGTAVDQECLNSSFHFHITDFNNFENAHFLRNSFIERLCLVSNSSIIYRLWRLQWNCLETKSITIHFSHYIAYTYIILYIKTNVGYFHYILRLAGKSFPNFSRGVRQHKSNLE